MRQNDANSCDSRFNIAHFQMLVRLIGIGWSEYTAHTHTQARVLIVIQIDLILFHLRIGRASFNPKNWGSNFW